MISCQRTRGRRRRDRSRDGRQPAGECAAAVPHGDVEQRVEQDRGGGDRDRRAERAQRRPAPGGPGAPGEQHEREQRARDEREEGELGEHSDGQHGADRGAAADGEPAPPGAGGRQERQRGGEVEEVVALHPRADEGEHRLERDHQRANGPRPWRSGDQLAQEEEDREHGARRHQRAEEPHQLEPRKDVVRRREPVRDRLERVVQRRLGGRDRRPARPERVVARGEAAAQLAAPRAR